MNKRLVLLFGCLVFVALGWLFLVPLWHTPDEQSHFGQVAFLAETGKNITMGESADLTEEIVVSEQLLGTKRDNFGNNKFTFHPEYRIDYTGTLFGKYEASIAALTKTKSRNTMVELEATRYPPLYYMPAAAIYRIFIQDNLFIRVYMVRLWSALLYITTVYFTYLIGKITFGKNSHLAYLLALLVGLHPMFIFASIGVTSDALANTLFTLYLYICAWLTRSGITGKKVVLCCLVTLAVVYTKPQFVLAIPISLLFVSFLYINQKRSGRLRRILISIGITTGVLYISSIVLRKGSAQIVKIFLQDVSLSSLIKFTIEYTIPHIYREVMPWYWGVYNWLGVTYPRVVHRFINWTVLLSLIGFVFWILHVYRTRSLAQKTVQIVFLFLGINMIFFTGISFYDWLSWHRWTYPLGVQGRYFFPLIATQMLFLLLGIRQLFSFHKRLEETGIKILTFMMILFNLYGWYTVARAYYDVKSPLTFIIQASQYKPWFAKGDFLVGWFLLYFLSLLVLSIILWKLRLQKSK